MAGRQVLLEEVRRFFASTRAKLDNPFCAFAGNADPGAAQFFPSMCRNPRIPNVMGLAAQEAPIPTKERPMQYMLLIYTNEAQLQSATKAQAEQRYSAYLAYTEALQKAGAWCSGNRLQPSTSASTVRVTKDKTEVLDGPYADTKEQLGGYYLIEAADLDAALGWAARCPGASLGRIEVRPIWTM
jgi:hypothetical protein